VSPSATESGEPTPEERRAAFRILRGEPTDEEVTALTVVLAAAAAPALTTAPATVRNRWSEPEARLRMPLHPGPGAWKTSTWPR
jgi:hypothetical protein